MADALTPDDIAAAAVDPQSASVDGRQAAAHSIPDQIAAHKYAAEQAALDATNANGGPRSAWAMLRPGRFRPTGSV